MNCVHQGTRQFLHLALGVTSLVVRSRSAPTLYQYNFRILFQPTDYFLGISHTYLILRCNNTICFKVENRNKPLKSKYCYWGITNSTYLQLICAISLSTQRAENLRSAPNLPVSRKRHLKRSKRDQKKNAFRVEWSRIEFFSKGGGRSILKRQR